MKKSKYTQQDKELIARLIRQKKEAEKLTNADIAKKLCLGTATVERLSSPSQRYQVSDAARTLAIAALELPFAEEKAKAQKASDSEKLLEAQRESVLTAVENIANNADELLEIAGKLKALGVRGGKC